MISRPALLAIALAASPFSVAGFSAPTLADCQNPTRLSAVANSRRDFVAAAAATVLLAGTVGALPAWAEVSAGDSLPQGAQQFKKLIRVKGDLKAVEKRVQSEASEMDTKEWDNISQFLRQIYQTGDDMKAIAGGIYDPEKNKQGLADAESMKKYAKSADVPVTKQDGKGFLAIAVKMDDTFEDFLEQLRDIPDEI